MSRLALLRDADDDVKYALPIDEAGRLQPDPRLDVRPDGSVVWVIRPGDRIELVG
jgi:hypothetical protein